jgi:EPS-associated MarR family transcriptional regulator
MGGDEFDFKVLQRLAVDPAVSQRGMASRLGVSVGKVNFCLQALMAKGWIKAGNFRRSDNKWAYAYVLTPAGAAAKLRLARAFLVRKVDEFETLQREIESLKRELEDAEVPKGAAPRAKTDLESA